MRKTLRKFVFSSIEGGGKKPTGAIDKRLRNIWAIWNNIHDEDVGIEKITRLFLAASQFFFPGIYIKQIFGRYGIDIQYLSMDVYILLKVFFPLSLLYFHWLDAPFVMAVVLWFMAETVLYVPTLIFASDGFSRPSSYRRSMLLLFFNYIEIIFAYAFIYSKGDYLNMPLKEWYDPIYFSFTTISTIGFGDYYPTTGMGKFLVCTQSLIFLTFVVLFINFISGKVESRGYFDHNNKD